VERAQRRAACLLWLTSSPSARVASPSLWLSAADLAGTAANALVRALDRLAPRRLIGSRLQAWTRRQTLRLLLLALKTWTQRWSRRPSRRWWTRNPISAKPG
jgi:hypothetical protein